MPAVLPGVLALMVSSSSAATHTVQATSGLRFSPSALTINVGDTVNWVNAGGTHDTVSYPGQSESWASPFPLSSYSHTFTHVGTFDYFCTPHEFSGMIGSITVVVPSTPPSVSITSPANGAVLATNFPVILKADAFDTDPNDGVIGVEFFDGATSLGVASSPPFELTVNGLALGAHSVTARARDTQSNATTSGAVSITMVTPAELRITSPKREGNQFSLTYATTPGLRYVVQSRASAASGSWNSLVTNVATGSSRSYTNTTAAGSGVYRVVLVP